MKKIFLCILFCCGFLCSLQSAAFSALVGMQRFSITSPMDNFSAYMWYPTETKGCDTTATSKIFKGVRGEGEAPIIDAQFPLILLSHEFGGNLFGLSWLAKELAQSGYIVACVGHRTALGAYLGPDTFVRIWDRTGDISLVLTALLDDPLWKAHIDTKRVGALGYSSGGNTVLLLAGARLNLENYARDVQQHPTLPENAVFTQSEYDFQKVDKDIFEGSYRDPRIQTVIAVDPSNAQAFEPKSLQEIKIPVTIIHLGNPDDDLWSSEKPDPIQTVRPDFSYEYIDDAVHVSWLGECKKKYSLLTTLFSMLRSSKCPLLTWIPHNNFILKWSYRLIPEEEEFQNLFLRFLMVEARKMALSPLCKEGKYKTRIEVHAQGVELVRAAFEKGLNRSTLQKDTPSNEESTTEGLLKEGLTSEEPTTEESTKRGIDNRGIGKGEM